MARPQKPSVKPSLRLDSVATGGTRTLEAVRNIKEDAEKVTRG